MKGRIYVPPREDDDEEDEDQEIILSKEEEDMISNALIPNPDIINKPEHYTLPRAASDCFSVMQQIGLLDEHCIAVVFQYIWRCKLKGQKLQDLKKARWFLDKAIEHEESTKGN